MIARLAVLLALAAPPVAPAGSLAPGYGSLGYELPAPGSYQLPPLGDAADGTVLDASAVPLRLHAL